MYTPMLPQTHRILEKIVVVSRWWNQSTSARLQPQQKKELESRLKAARKNIDTDIRTVISDIKQIEKQLELEKMFLDRLKYIADHDIEFAEDHLAHGRRFKK